MLERTDPEAYLVGAIFKRDTAAAGPTTVVHHNPGGSRTVHQAVGVTVEMRASVTGATELNEPSRVTSATCFKAAGSLKVTTP